MKAVPVLLAVAGAILLAACGKDDDPSKLTCNDLGKIKDNSVLAQMKEKCGLGGQPFTPSEKKEW